MLENLLINIIPFTILFSLGIANSYEEKTVYTQALLTVTYGDSKKIKPSGNYVQKSPTGLIEGELFYAGRDIDWCSTIPSTVKIPPAKPRWIAIIPPVGSNCTCTKKINLAKKLNASAVLIYAFDSSVYEAEEKDIIAVIIAPVDGNHLVNLYTKEKPNPVLCEIKMGKKMIEKQFRVSKTSVLFVLVSFILLMCISLAWLVFYYVQRFRHIYRNDRKEKQLLSAAKKAISKLKTISFQAGNKDGEEETCAVCLENYKDGENIRILPCKHEFHKACIDPWLLNHRTCPMCKNNILKSLGVEIPDNIDLTQHDMESRRTSRDAETVHSSPAPSPSPPVEPVTDEIVEPSTSVFTPGGSTSQAWSEPNVVSASCYSSTSSMLSDTDSERSTVALVSVTQKV